MLKQEWKQLFQNKILMFILIVLLFVPSIYTTGFLGSMWDPYGKLSKLPVAVVNEDQSVAYRGKTLEVGEKLSNQLNKNDALGFQSVPSKKEAMASLKAGSYYMVIVIPKNFSKNATTLLQTHPEKMKLEYYTNPGKNYIASKMSESAMEKVKNKVSDQVTKTYTEVLFDEIADAGKSIRKAADGADTLSSGIQKLSNGNGRITSNLNTLAKGALTFETGTEKLNKGLSDYFAGTVKIKAATAKLSNGSGKLVNGLNQIQTGTTVYTSGAERYTKGVDTYLEGTLQLYKGVQKLSGLQNLGQVSNAIQKLNYAVSDTTNKESLRTGTMQLSSGLNALSEQVKTLSKKADVKKLAELSTAVQTANKVITGSNSGLQKLSAALKQETALIKKLQKELNQMAASVQIEAKKQSVTAINKLVTAENKKVDASNSQIEAVLGKVQASSLQESEKKELITKLQSAKLAHMNTVSASDLDLNLDTLVSSYQTELTKAVGVIDKINQSVTQAEKDLGTASGYLTKIQTGLSSASFDTSAIQKLSDALETASKGTAKIDAGVSQVGTALGTLQSKTSNFGVAASGMKQIDSGFQKLTKNNQKLNTAGKQLRDSGSILKSTTTTASKGMKTLSDGSSKLSGAMNLLTDNNMALQTGASQLTVASGKIVSGSEKLTDGSRQLGSGLLTAGNGSDALAKGLNKGAKKLQKTKGTDRTTSMFSSPVTISEDKVTTVETNGYAMAPYMMSVGLWVACISFTLMYPILKHRGELSTGFHWWLSKASVLFPLSVGMACILVGVLHKVLGFTPYSWSETFVVAISTSLACMAIQYFFTSVFGKVGNFMMLIFTVVQLGGSAGTYPLELSGKVVKDVHKWLPFSYSVDAYRAAISGAGTIYMDVWKLWLYAIVFTLATIIIFTLRTRRIKANKSTFMDLFTKFEEA